MLKYFTVLAALVCAGLNAEYFYFAPIKSVVDPNIVAKLAAGPERFERRWSDRWQYMIPYANCGEGKEVYATTTQEQYTLPGVETYTVAVRSQTAGPIRGRLYFPERDFSGMRGLDFNFSEPAADQTTARKEFYRAKERYYARLLGLNCPAGAWLRHEMMRARAAINNSNAPDRDAISQPSRGTDQFQETFDFFAGSQALIENLQLDRNLRVAESGPADINISTITGITTAAMDFNDTQTGQVKRDYLAEFVPADQYAVFYQSYGDMMKVSAFLDTDNLQILKLTGRSEDSRIKPRYLEQMCIAPDMLSKIFGPRFINSIVFTGSDPFFRTGTDVTVMFEAAQLGALRSNFASKQKSAISSNPQARAVKGTIAGREYVGAVSPDRSVCSYMTTHKNAVIISNSLVQLGHVLETIDRKTPSMAIQPEYKFFRSRYRINDSNETGLIVLTDAAIRKWCSPQWRIGDSRRIRAAAAMGELRCRYMDKLTAGNFKPFTVDVNNPDLGKLTLTTSGIISDKWGTLDYMTPICEMQIGKITAAEKRSYEFFRNMYQRNWRNYFDPIAIKFYMDEETLDFDITVRPLIAGSDYRRFIEVCGSKKLLPGDADRHRSAILQAAMAIDSNSEPVKELGSFASTIAPDAKVDLLSWIGSWVTIYAEEDVAWAKLSQMRDGRDYSNDLSQLPVALEISVASPFKLAGFLVALRAFADQTAPGMLKWENRKNGNQPYVKVSPENPGSHFPDANTALYYAPMPDRLIISLREDILKSAMTRSGDRINPERAKLIPDKCWLGEHLNFVLRPRAVEMLEILFSSEIKSHLERRCWANIYVLNEWRNRFGSKYPVEFHKQIWHSTLLCPARGQYTWNPQLNTMESTVLGSPARPANKYQPASELLLLNWADLGITFEISGLRARGAVKKFEQQ